MTKDLRIGDDIQMASINIPALEVVNQSDDDIELISDGITHDDPCKSWYSARVPKDGMLHHSIIWIFEVYIDSNYKMWAFGLIGVLILDASDAEISIGAAIVA